MEIRSSIIRRIGAGLIGISLTACAVPYAPPSLLITPAGDRDMVEVFVAGYRNITEKYIDPVSVQSLALKGLEGLSSIDPDLKASAQGGQIVLTYSGNIIKSIVMPDSGNVIGWADLTSEIAAAARSVSTDVGGSSNEKIYEAVFDGVLSDLDIYSRYAGSVEAKKNRARRDGFGGIGINFQAENNGVTITNVILGTPAYFAKLSKNDVIVLIDGKSVTGLRNEEVVDLLRGPTQTKTVLMVTNKTLGSPREVTLIRTHIVPITVTEKRDHGVLYLKISSFNQDTARTLADHLRTAKNEMGVELKGIILDLRGNPGGLLKQSVKVSDLLLTHGGIVSTKGRHFDSLHNYEAGGRDLADGLPVVVFIDGKSASAAEIVAAALQDRNRAVLIGTASYGKGTVQTVIRLPNDGEITLTWSRFMAPSGYPLHGLGVRPVLCTSSQASAVNSPLEFLPSTSPGLKSTFESWRIPTLQPESARNKLRQTCPPEKHKDQAEMKLAKRIFDDLALYSRTLDISAGTSQARK